MPQPYFPLLPSQWEVIWALAVNWWILKHKRISAGWQPPYLDKEWCAFKNQSSPTKGIEKGDGCFSKCDVKISFKKWIYILKLIIYIKYTYIEIEIYLFQWEEETLHFIVAWSVNLWKGWLIFCWTLRSNKVNTCLTFRALKIKIQIYRVQNQKPENLAAFCPDYIFSVLYYKLQFFQQLVRIVVPLTSAVIWAQTKRPVLRTLHIVVYIAATKNQLPSRTDEFVEVSPVGYPTLLVITLDCFLYQIIPPL